MYLQSEERAFSTVHTSVFYCVKGMHTIGVFCGQVCQVTFKSAQSCFTVTFLGGACHAPRNFSCKYSYSSVIKHCDLPALSPDDDVCQLTSCSCARFSSASAYCSTFVSCALHSAAAIIFSFNTLDWSMACRKSKGFPSSGCCCMPVIRTCEIAFLISSHSSHANHFIWTYQSATLRGSINTCAHIYGCRIMASYASVSYATCATFIPCRVQHLVPQASARQQSEDKIEKRSVETPQQARSDGMSLEERKQMKQLLALSLLAVAKGGKAKVCTPMQEFFEYTFRKKPNLPAWPAL